jgi:diguanylate cyclase (GGDEF)-like protein
MRAARVNNDLDLALVQLDSPKRFALSRWRDSIFATNQHQDRWLRSAERLIGLQRELIRLATIDPLTGVLNRRAFFEKAEQAVARASVAGPMAAIMFDVDHFKSVNDTHGHDVGDQVLCGISREAADGRMIVGRLGGEEFAILLEGADEDAAIELAEGLRAKMAALACDAERGNLGVTCSFGVSQLQTGESIDQLLKRADSALYEAKSLGRNRVARARPFAESNDPRGSGVIRLSNRAGSAERAPARMS